jgi:predicted GIY-YIG superfamily endonuclease
MPANAGISRDDRYARLMGGWVYIMASRRDGMLYVGVTAHLAARVDQHRRDRGPAIAAASASTRWSMPSPMS